MKYRISFVYIFLSFIFFTQIISKEEIKKMPARKTVPVGPGDTFINLDLPNFYVSMNTSSSFRKLETNEDFLLIPLNDRANEIPLFTNSFTLGVNGKIYKNIGWDGAMSFIQNGEQYVFSAIDSSFSYKTRYRYISMPVRINYTIKFGSRFGCKLGVGIAPLLFINYKQDQEWQTSEGSTGTNSIKTNVGFNTAVFNFSSYLYFIYRLPSNFGLFVGPEYRYQLNNSYEKTADYKHYSRALGITFGVYKSIN
ncbi:MAG: hypothetical protein P8I93_06190 [Crocinitomicaceae bacterium]|nr:hypothetical protein [Crocinitomicaceae bacterium]